MRACICHIIFAVCVLHFSSSAQQSDLELRQSFDQLILGMSIEKVREMVGPPTRIEPFKIVHIATSDTTVCWYYAYNDWTIFFKNKYLDRIEKKRDQMLIKIQQWADPKNADGIKLIYGK